jgi:hypothetical protein
LKFFRQNNYTEKAKLLYSLNLVYFLSLVGLWQNHLLYWPLTDFMWRNRTPFGKRVVNKYGSVCYNYRSFLPWNFTHVSKYRWGTYLKRKTCLLFKHEKNNQTLSNDWPTYCQTRTLSSNFLLVDSWYSAIALFYLTVLQQKHVQIKNNHTWTSAFFNFMSVMLEKWSGKAQVYLKYMHVIRLAASRVSNLGWVLYDEQFRLRKARAPQSSCADVDVELWLLYVSTPEKTTDNFTFRQLFLIGVGQQRA